MTDDSATDAPPTPSAASGDEPLQGEEHDGVLDFPEGIPGFPNTRKYTLVSHVDDAAFMLLQCLDDTAVSLIVTVPWLFFPDYAPQISEIESSQLGLETPEEALVFSPVTLDKDNDAIYLNLLGPFVVNARTRVGRQLVLVDSDYPTRALVDVSEW